MKHLKLLATLLLASAVSAVAQPRVEDGFVRPPDDARPWVYWFWSDGNVTRPGITADLEAMKRVGVGGVIWMEVDQAVPKGPARFMSPQWRELMAFSVAEASRLGLKIDLNNDAGWSGSGGPWMDAEHSMQNVVWTETRVKGPSHFDGALTAPQATAGFYRDIAVLAYPAPTVERRLERFAPKSGLGVIASPEQPVAVPAGAAVNRAQVVDLTSQLREGRLTWDAPSGEWTVIRIGHTSTGRTNKPSVAEGLGLEVDKFSAKAFSRYYDGFVAKVIADAGQANAALSAVHIDSWEVGFQNWTAGFRDEFIRRRGYDPLPMLPAFAGQVIDSAEITERFLWDVRRTISELVNDNYAQAMADRAHADGKVFTLEAYNNGPFDCLSYGGRADVPVAEFWMTKDPTKMHASVKTMTSVGHIYGRSVIAAEAFTATDALGRQRNHPYSMKAIGDAAFCAGVNHFVVHRYSMQPWVDERKPGMTMGPWGVEYERTATWWEQTKPWHEYVARCQYLLRQGRFVGDFCYLQSEEGINNPTPVTTLLPAVPEGYDFDFCSDEVVRTRMQVQNGRLVLPDGMSYRVLVLPQQRLMTPALLRKIRDLVRDGAVVFGRPPLRSPSLSGYPACDAEVKQLVAELWGEAATGESPVDRAVGKGRVLWAPTLDAVLPKLQLAPDFAFRLSTADRPAPAAAAAPAEVPAIRYIHRTLSDREVYFVANLSASPASLVASFRASGAPELWNAENGTMTPAPVFDAADGRVRVALALEPRGSRFVVFRASPAAPTHVVRVTKDGATLYEASPVPIDRAVRPAQRFEPVINSFTMAAWVKPTGDTALPKETATGTGAYTVARNDVLYPPPVHEVLGPLDLAGAGFAVGRNGITVLEHGDHLFAATLVAPMPVTDWTFVAVVFNAGVPTLYVNGERVKTGLKTAATVYGGVGVPHGRDVEPFRGDYSAVRQIGRALTATEVRQWMLSTPKTPVPPRTASSDAFVTVPLPPLQFAERAAWIGAPGSYEVQFANGQKRTVKPAAMPPPIRVEGPWTVRFPAGWGAPAEIQLPALGSWSEQSDPGVRYFSGTATYSKTVDVPSARVGPNYRTWLELGEVQVIAEVTLNGRPLTTLWKPPYRVDLTPALKAGRNELEVRVTNLWVNRLIGDEQLPLDREWTKVPRRGGFALKSYPDWFVRGERSPTGRVTFTTWKHYEKDAPLMRSGLIGPVTLQTQVKVPIE